MHYLTPGLQTAGAGGNVTLNLPILYVYLHIYLYTHIRDLCSNKRIIAHVCIISLLYSHYTHTNVHRVSSRDFLQSLSTVTLAIVVGILVAREIKCKRLRMARSSNLNYVEKYDIFDKFGCFNLLFSKK